MCGILGVWNLDGEPVRLPLLRAMSAVMAHRGPDDEGYVGFDSRGNLRPRTAGGPRTPAAARKTGLPFAPPAEDPGALEGDVAIGQVRLSIIDLSPRGHQPMCNEDGRVWVTFGGEIYNYVELRDSLRGRGHTFRTGTDTEVLVHGYEEWGEDLFGRLNGMWALAIWDARRKVLVCSRDRLGIKPFYYWSDSKTFAFASEIRPLLHLAETLGRPVEPGGAAIADLITNARVDSGAETFFAPIQQMVPAHYAVVDRGGPRWRRYWDLIAPEAVDGDGAPEPERAWPGELASALSEAVRLRLHADVPVGTCLSGGLDSSSIVALSCRHLDGPIDAYSVAYTGEGSAFDERSYMYKVAEATGARHHLTVPDADDLLLRLRRVVHALEEPAAGPGVFSQWQVMELASRQGTKVLLDGQGADELFGGYVSFYYPLALRDLLQARRLGEASALASAVVGEGRGRVELLGRVAEPLVPGSLYGWARAHHGAGDWESVLAPRFARRHVLPVPPVPGRFADRLTSRLYWDLTRDILPSLLRYEDRNSMAFSIEARVPFLDVDVVELAFAMPGAVKLNGQGSKWVLRQAMRGVVPDAILRRTDKRGFETPVTRWLRRDLAADMRHWIVGGRAVDRGILDREASARTVDAFLAGDAGKPEHEIWRLVNLELWLREYFDGWPDDDLDRGGR